LHAELLSSETLDPRVGAAPAATEALGRAWRELRRRYPAAFSASPQEVFAWHRRTAEGFALQAAEFPSMGESKRAVAAYSEALRAGYSDIRIWRERGSAWLGLRRWERAVADFSKVISLSPNDAEARETRRAAYAELGQWRLAAAD